MKTLILNKYGKGYRVTLNLDHYIHYRNLYVGFVAHEGNHSVPYGDLTINLGVPCKANCAYIDVNSNGDEIIEWLCKNKLGSPTGHMASNDFCVYPEFEFNMKALMKHANRR